MTFLEFRIETMRMVLQLNNVMMWMRANAASLSNEAVLFLGMFLVTFGSYARKTMEIINDPTTVAPILGRRCIFY